jgi:hypothetical protein
MSGPRQPGRELQSFGPPLAVHSARSCRVGVSRDLAETGWVRSEILVRLEESRPPPRASAPPARSSGNQLCDPPCRWRMARAAVLGGGSASWYAAFDAPRRFRSSSPSDRDLRRNSGIECGRGIGGRSGVSFRGLRKGPGVDETCRHAGDAIFQGVRRYSELFQMVPPARDALHVGEAARPLQVFLAQLSDRLGVGFTRPLSAAWRQAGPARG